MTSRIIYRVHLTAHHVATGATRHIVAGDPMPLPSELRIEQAAGNVPQYFDCYLLYLDADGRTMTDTYHTTPEAALEQATFEFRVQPEEWEKVGEPLVGLAPVRLSGFARVPVTVTGGWQDRPGRKWHGVAAADEPLVAVSFITSGTHTVWFRSEKHDHPPEGIRPYCWMMDCDREGRHVRIQFGAGATVAIASRLSSSTYRPRLGDRQVVCTGETFGMTYIEGEPRAEFHLLFLIRRDVRGGRKGLWQARRSLAMALPEPWHRILTHGRTGSVDWAGFAST